MHDGGSSLSVSLSSGVQVFMLNGRSFLYVNHSQEIKGWGASGPLSTFSLCVYFSMAAFVYWCGTKTLAGGEAEGEELSFI